jgi:hypothetical protein
MWMADRESHHREVTCKQRSLPRHFATGARRKAVFTGIQVVRNSIGKPRESRREDTRHRTHMDTTPRNPLCCSPS